MLLFCIDHRSDTRLCHVLSVSDLFKSMPECIFKADARLAAAYDDGTFDNGGFHRLLPTCANVLTRLDCSRRYHAARTVSKRFTTSSTLNASLANNSKQIALTAH